MKTYFFTKPCTEMSIALLFVIVKQWKQPGCSPTDESKNMVYPYEKNVIWPKGNVLIPATTWLIFERIMLGEISQSKKTTTCRIPLL